MALPPWLNISPTLALQALEAGTQAGSNIASRRQQAAQFEAEQNAQAARLASQFRRGEAQSALEDAYRRDRDVVEDQRAAEALRLKRDEAQALREYRQAGVDARQSTLDLREREFAQRLTDREAKSEAERALNRRLAEAIATGADIVELVSEDPSLMQNELAQQLVRNKLISGRSKGSKYATLEAALNLHGPGSASSTNQAPQPFRIRSVR